MSQIIFILVVNFSMQVSIIALVLLIAGIIFYEFNSGLFFISMY
jgi:hypothetical protein